MPLKTKNEIIINISSTCTIGQIQRIKCTCKWKWKKIYLYQMLRYSSYINTKYGNTINPSSSMFFSFWCFVEMKERGKVHWFLAAGGQNRPVQTRNYSISLPRRHNIHIQQLSNSKGWWKKCFWMYQLTNIFMMRGSSKSKNMFAIYNISKR